MSLSYEELSGNFYGRVPDPVHRPDVAWLHDHEKVLDLRRHTKEP